MKETSSSEFDQYPREPSVWEETAGKIPEEKGELDGYPDKHAAIALQNASTEHSEDDGGRIDATPAQTVEESIREARDAINRARGLYRDVTNPVRDQYGPPRK